MAERSKDQLGAPMRAADKVPGIPLIFAMLAKKREEKEDKQYQFVPVEYGPAALPSEVNPPITKADFKGDE